MNYTLERLQNMSKEEVDMAYECLKRFPCGNIKCDHCPMAYAECVELPPFIIFVWLFLMMLL